jgi:hypothetical protein
LRGKWFGKIRSNVLEKVCHAQLFFEIDTSHIRPVYFRSSVAEQSSYLSWSLQPGPLDLWYKNAAGLFIT